MDIHDRVNYAVSHSALFVDPTKMTITLSLTIDTEISTVMDYFEIFFKPDAFMPEGGGGSFAVFSSGN